MLGEAGHVLAPPVDYYLSYTSRTRHQLFTGLFLCRQDVFVTEDLPTIPH